MNNKKILALKTAAKPLQMETWLLY